MDCLRIRRINWHLNSSKAWEGDLWRTLIRGCKWVKYQAMQLAPLFYPYEIIYCKKAIFNRSITKSDALDTFFNLMAFAFVWVILDFQNASEISWLKKSKSAVNYKTHLLKYCQHKNDATQLKMPPFFRHLHGEREKAAISKVISFSTDLRLSYIVCTLGMRFMHIVEFP